MSTALSFFPTSGATFGVMTTGSVFLADDDNTSGSSGVSLDGATVYDASEVLIDAPRRRSKASEEVRAELNTGDYFVRVVGVDGAWDDEHHYQLKIQVLGTPR